MELLEPQIMQCRFSDFDELTDALKGWNLEFQKLDAGPFRADTHQLISPGFFLSRAQANSRLKQLGEPPPGLRNFVIPGRAEMNLLWRAKQVTGSDLMKFPVGGELHAFCQPGFDVFTLSIAEDLLDGLIDLRCFREREILHCRPASLDKLRKLLHRAFQRAEHFDTTQTQILRQLARTANEALSIEDRGESFKVQAISRAERFILSHPEEAITVQGLCDDIGVSRRALEYAFVNHLGVSPKAYINAVRLNGVRKELHHGCDGMRVADAANARGFWHMGQFAKDYRKLFGELPSETMERCSCC